MRCLSIVPTLLLFRLIELPCYQRHNSFFKNALSHGQSLGTFSEPLLL